MIEIKSDSKGYLFSKNFDLIYIDFFILLVMYHNKIV